MTMHFEPKKLYYKIGEVCEILGVEAYVLRYWETEFAALKPPKSKSGQRTYRPKDIELLMQIRKLLYEDGFTIAGARKRLSAGSAPAVPPRRKGVVHKAPGATGENLSKVREELQNMLTLLERE